MSDKRYTALVPQGLDDADRLIYGRTPEDILIYLGLPVMVWFVLSMLDIIPVLAFAALSTASITITAILYRKAGTDTTVTEYLRAKHHRLQLPTSAPKSSGQEPEDGHRPLRSDGGDLGGLINDFTTTPTEIEMWEDDTPASEYTRIRNVYPQFDVIQREDGAYITALEISGTNLFLRSRSEQNRLIEQFVGALREIDYPHQLFITTRDFDVNAHADAHQTSGRHDDITSNPILEELHAEYQQEVINDRRIQQTRKRQVYAVLAYQPGSDRTDDTGPDSIEADSEADLERRQEAIDRLLSRRTEYRSLLTNITGVSAHPVDYQTHLAELVGHWESPLYAETVDVPASPIIPPAGFGDDDSGGMLA